MTTLDMSIPYYPVLMILKDIPNNLQIQLPAGYHFQSYDDSFKEAWIQLHVRLGQLETIDKGRLYFKETFETHPEELKNQMILIVDDSGKLAGTSSIWEGYHFGEKRFRVHWVGVDEAHQKKGLAKALMLRSIQLYERMNEEKPLYLTTQTNSYVAISMYKKLGFEPYKGEMPINFHANAETFKETNDLAWKIIDECIEKL